MPPTVIVSVSSLLVITSWPWLLSDAVTFALPTRLTLMALIRSATVSVPVDMYVVALAPALTVIAPFLRIPRLDSVVLVVTGAVPVPLAGEPEELDDPEAAEGLEELELEVVEADDPLDVLGDDDVEPPDVACSALCTAADSSELTRFKAVPLAMLARPFAKLVSAWPITLISESSADAA
jgi:hypothetical protein